MTTTRLRRTTLNTATLQEVALHRIGWSATGAVANPYLPKDTPKAIKAAMVLYYDIAKQKATNESMSLSPILKDLSGNGNDATCYNFGWSGMSGIGGYITNNTHYEFTEDIYYKNIISGSQEHITVKFTIKGLVSGNEVTMQSLNGKRYGSWTSDGTYTVDSDRLDDSSIYIYNGINATRGNFTVDILPQYPNALVSDGVNDYCLVQDRYDDEGNLINKKSLVLNKEDGYTVIAKRVIVNQESHTDGSLISDRNNYGEGAYSVESFQENNNCHSINWNHDNVISAETDEFIYQNSTSYCGQSLISGPDITSSNPQGLLFKSILAGTHYGAYALYSLLLFNRDLTDEEIQWVKTNLIEVAQ